MNKSKTFLTFILSLSFLLSACHHNPLNTKLSQNWVPLSNSTYKKFLKKNTKGHKEYVGLHLSFEAHLVFLDSQIQLNQIKMKSQYKNWDESEALVEKQKMEEKTAKFSEFFLSFYSPKTKRNKLDQRASDWRVVLKTGSNEFEGVIKYNDNISNHTSVFYPHLDPWGKFYSVTFPISTQSLENNKFELVLMGPEGMASLKY